jgi:hypothetical protein
MCAAAGSSSHVTWVELQQQSCPIGTVAELQGKADHLRLTVAEQAGWRVGGGWRDKAAERTAVVSVGEALNVMRKGTPPWESKQQVLVACSRPAGGRRAESDGVQCQAECRGGHGCDRAGAAAGVHEPGVCDVQNCQRPEYAVGATAAARALACLECVVPQP